MAATTTMGVDDLPLEVLDHIFRFIPSDGRWRVGFVCRRWLRVLQTSLPEARSLSVHLHAACAHQLTYSGEPEKRVDVCAHTEAELVDEVTRRCSPDLRRVEIDDLQRAPMHDTTMGAVLGAVDGKRLESLALLQTDLSAVRPWTLAMMARLHALRELYLADCELPPALDESQLIRTLAPVLERVERMEITRCSRVSDKLGRAVARCGRALGHLSLAGCPAVSALTVVALAETAHLRKVPHMDVRMNDTGFNTEMLDKCLASPLLRVEGWRAQLVQLPLGFQQPAVLVHRQGEPVALTVQI